MWTFAVEASGETAAVLAGVASLLGAAGGLVYKFTTTADDRTDKVTETLLKSMGEDSARDRANASRWEMEAATARTDAERARSDAQSARSEVAFLSKTLRESEAAILDMRVTIASLLAVQQRPPDQGPVRFE